MCSRAKIGKVLRIHPELPRLPPPRLKRRPTHITRAVLQSKRSVTPTRHRIRRLLQPPQLFCTAVIRLPSRQPAFRHMHLLALPKVNMPQLVPASEYSQVHRLSVATFRITWPPISRRPPRPAQVAIPSPLGRRASSITAPPASHCRIRTRWLQPVKSRLAPSAISTATIR